MQHTDIPDELTCNLTDLTVTLYRTLLEQRRVRRYSVGTRRQYTGCPFYRVPEHRGFIAWDARILREARAFRRLTGTTREQQTVTSRCPVRYKPASCLTCEKDSHASLNDGDTFWEMRRQAISSLCERHTVYLHKPRQYSIANCTPMLYGIAYCC